MANIPNIHLALASLISIGKSSGTGFIFRTDTFAYLVTARHVLYQDDGKLRNPEIEVCTPTTNLHDDSTFNYQIDLSIATHIFHKKNDVAIIKIAEVSNIRREGEEGLVRLTYSKGITRTNQGYSKPTLCRIDKISLLNDVQISGDIYVSGYPTSLGIETNKQFDNTKPLLRKGIVANVYKETQTIILDCPVYGGNSGGPVIQVLEIDGKKKYRVIGVVSQFIPFVQRWKNERDRITNLEYLNSGYSVATSFDIVIEMVNSIEQES
jgi:V8-like Glu-specific endopeptidase